MTAAPSTTTSTDPKETTVTNPAPNTTLEPAETAETDPKGTPAPEGTDPPVETGEGNREAAKYRTRLREAEAERDRLAGIVEGMQRAEIEKRATAAQRGWKLHDAADLWRAGVELKDLLAADGTVDQGKVNMAVRQLVEEHPHWGVRIGAIPRDMGQGQRGSTGGGGTSWADVIGTR